MTAAVTQVTLRNAKVTDNWSKQKLGRKLWPLRKMREMIESVAAAECRGVQVLKDC